MKKSKLLVGLAAVAFAGSTMASGLKLCAEGYHEIKVNCPGGLVAANPIPDSTAGQQCAKVPLVGGDVFSWFLLKKDFGQSFDCTFSEDGSTLGSAHVEVNGSNSQGLVHVNQIVDPDTHYVDITPGQDTMATDINAVFKKKS